MEFSVIVTIGSMAHLEKINAEFFKPYLTVLKYFRCTGIDIFNERNVFLYKFKYTPVIILLCLIITAFNHWRYVIEAIYSGTDLLELAGDISFCYNAIESPLIYLHLILIKGKIRNYVFKLEKLWRNDDSLRPNEILLKRDQVKQIDSYQRIYCFLLGAYIHFYFGIPLLIILIKKILKRDVLYLTPMKFTLPFDYQNNIVLFVIFYLFDYSIIWKMGYVVLGSLFFMSVSMNQLRTLFILLQEDFKEIIKAKDADIDVKLKQTIQKHSTLLDMLAQLGDAYGAIFAIHVFFLCITICFYGIAAKINSRLSDLKNLMASVIITVNIYHCCKHGQLATDSVTACYLHPFHEFH
ncbi:uncharacterized protein LOC123869332 isoform X2 [Maniola jurtina]|uniref:uncharacterized protein LOC123869332 isoform X2 n=1 Tax=Maniola jurtina TaxID=191418 RepID=UPI001E686106|nr:uncharacterized protein LOC123869332 isoform X2 [Maniola jurtina]